MYFPQITFSRYVAAFIVILHHFAQVDEVRRIPIVGHILSYANTLLSFFFVLTGFVLILSLHRNDRMPSKLPLPGLLAHRLPRLLPLHWLALVMLVLLQPWTSSESPGAGLFAVHAVLLQSWYPVPASALAYNYVSWTLSVELLLLLLAPWLYRWMRTQPTPRLLLTVGAIWLGSLLLLQLCRQLGMPVDWGYFWPPVHVPEFMLGMASGFVVIRHRPLLQHYARWLHVSAVLNGILIVVVMSTALPFLYRNSLVFAPSYVLLLLNTTVYEDSWYTRLFHTRPMLYLGKISYAVYILQLPVSVLVLRIVHPMMGWPFRYSGLLFLLVLPAVAGLAYEWVEKPVVGYTKARLSRLMARQTTTDLPLPDPGSTATAPVRVLT